VPHSQRLTSLSFELDKTKADGEGG
jgi:hypothetical protein